MAIPGGRGPMGVAVPSDSLKLKGDSRKFSGTGKRVHAYALMQSVAHNGGIKGDLEAAMVTRQMLGGRSSRRNSGLGNRSHDPANSNFINIGHTESLKRTP